MTDKGPKFDDTVFKKLWKLMRRGSLIAPKIKPSLDTPDEVTSFQRDFGMQSSRLQLGQWWGAGSSANYDTNRQARYAEYAIMESVPEIQSALNLVADEATSRSEDGKVLFVESKNEAIKKILESLFFDTLDIDFYIWGWTRTTCKYGEHVLYFDVHPKNGIERVITIPVNDFKRIDGTYDDPRETKFEWISTNRSLENWQVAHFRLLGQDKFLPYGTSFIEAARSFWRKLVVMEDAMLVYRVLRAPERRVFYIDVTGVAPDHIEDFMKKVEEKLRKTNVINRMYGQVDQRFDPLDVSEDYFIPMRGEQTTRIESLPGGQHVNDIEDVEYLLKKLIAALGIPRAYLTYEEDLANKSTLASLDIRFSRTIERIQRAMLSELTKIAMVHLIVMGFEGEDLLNFDLKLTNPSNLASMQKLDLLERRVNVAAGLQNEKLFDRSFVQKRFFNLKDDELKKIAIGRMKDAHLDGKIAFIESQSSEQGSTEEFGGGGAGGGGITGALPGEGEGGGEELEGEELAGPEELGGAAEGEEIITASNDAFDKAKQKRKETDYAKGRRKAKERNQSGLINLSNYVNVDGDDTHNDPFDKKTFSRLVKGLESETSVKMSGGRKNLLTERNKKDLISFTSESTKDREVNIVLDEEKEGSE